MRPDVAEAHLAQRVRSWSGSSDCKGKLNDRIGYALDRPDKMADRKE